MVNNYRKRDFDGERNSLEEILAQLEKGVVSTKHVNIIANAVGDHSIAIAGDVNDSLVIAGNVEITRVYHIPPIVREKIEKTVQESIRSRTVGYWLIVAISWIIPSLVVSMVVKDYSEKLFRAINQLFYYLLAFGNHLYYLYFVVVMIVIGFLLIIGRSKSGYAFGGWLWRPLVFVVALAIYQQLILNAIAYLRMIGMQDFYLLCIIITTIYFLFGSITVLKKERNIRDDWLFYMASPIINFVHMHIILFHLLWKQK